MLHQQTQHVESMLKLRWHANIIVLFDVISIGQ